MRKISVVWGLLCVLQACQIPGVTLEQANHEYRIIPEYEPVQAMLISEHLAAFPNGQALFKTLLEQDIAIWFLGTDARNAQSTSSILQRRFAIQADDLSRFRPLPIATQTVWARDWAPIFAVSEQDQAIGLLDFRYYPDRPQDDTVPEQMLPWLSGHYRRVGVNVELEGGNLMCTRKDCFVTEEVVKRITTRTGQAGDAAQLKTLIAAPLAQSLWLVPRMPYEATGHIDIWSKFLNDKTVIIGQISSESLAQVPVEQQAKYTEVQAFLEMQATGRDVTGQEVPNALASRLKEVDPDIQIVRIPMPTPGVVEGYDVFRTYTNSLLINGVAVVPRYGRGQRSRSGRRELHTEMEGAVEQVYRDAGYRVIWIQADNLIRDGGAWHCVSMQVPQF